MVVGVEVDQRHPGLHDPRVLTGREVVGFRPISLPLFQGHPAGGVRWSSAGPRRVCLLS